MKPTRTSKAWMREHVNDPFVKKAKLEGYRSRASYKLMEIDDRDKLIVPGSSVVDLGATPGGWSQVAKERLKGRGRVVAIDILPMVPIQGVDFLEGDFNDPHIRQLLKERLPSPQIDLVLSDLAPNISGVALYDQARATELWVAALEFAVQCLKPNGQFLVKVFHGIDFEDFVRLMRAVFITVQTRKPAASRDRSTEVYLLGKTLREDAQSALDRYLGAE
ncbi:RlmE family RNA methyltransferase [Ferrovum sp. PN-J185]|uniref:RlmE family RNA methyltransferase n=1 Tax=Ferrovum sp. PN-J185 TaxID=1356306 RepID=UPI00079AF662|nr:RlmE family RNA methyltransferase [Ferrovum sp. PN-J185]KXW56167.1 ribosomal RNA large subunit methyltransferase E [Ferrovum sp. PN-J185]MCC6067771.1 RlmE family RNA methyltransferase [Ferrovum sp. PN-J185]MDE1892211.1 RlmE family RNA methyltransferase [Betaproteobacteria bacterium]MDE2056809.1 RlmE family RNA methyltransferase [Betaproteobacteria bacterium]